jgi:hypothetical protein
LKEDRMIHYTLVCAKGHEFDGWFRGSAGFDEQKRLGVLVCPDCGSTDVGKGIMAPNVATGGSSRSDEAEHAVMPRGEADRLAHMRRLMMELRAHVEKTCDYVGERFPEEARKIHYGETEQRNIYGEATIHEAGALAEEGIEVMPLPVPPRCDG